jgi:putative SOS response-associated peptidase YedK
MRYRRCLVPADAFYEWQKLDPKNKQPFAIAMKDGQPYAVAGLWERWKDRNAGTDLLAFTVIERSLTFSPHERKLAPMCLSGDRPSGFGFLRVTE